MKQLLLLLVFVLSSVTITLAQNENDAPLVVTRYEDDAIYIVEGDTLMPVCETGEPRAHKSMQRSDDVFRSSPQGTQIVFTTWANGEPDPDILPSLTEAFQTNTWLCDVRSGEVSQLPRDPGMFTSLPVFSSNGSSLAWAQRTGEDSEIEVVTYDIASDETQIISRIEPDLLRFAFPALDWSQPGIAISQLVDMNEAEHTHVVHVVDPTEAAGEQVFTYTGPLAVGATLRGVWVEYEGEVRLWLQGLHDQPLSPSIVSFFLATPDFETIAEVRGELRYIPRQQASDIYYTVNSIVTPDFATLLPEAFDLALSPDAEQIAFITADNFPYGADLYVAEELASVFNPERLTVPTLIGEVALFNEPGIQSISWGVPQQVIVESDLPTPDLQMHVSEDGFQTLVPLGWQADGNSFARDANTVLVIGSGNDFTHQEVVQDVLGAAAVPSGMLETAIGTWTLYTADYYKQDSEATVRVHMGVIDIEGWIFTVILQATQAEAPFLFDLVFIPALYNFALS